MSKSWYGHHIETIKGDDYVLFKDYLELDKMINIMEKYLELIYDIGYDYDGLKSEEELDEVFMLFRIVFPAMWW